MTFTGRSHLQVCPTHEADWPRRLAEEADSRSQTRSCPEWPARTQGVNKARPPDCKAGGVLHIDGGVGFRRGRRLLVPLFDQ